VRGFYHYMKRSQRIIDPLEVKGCMTERKEEGLDIDMQRQIIEDLHRIWNGEKAAEVKSSSRRANRK